MERDKSIRLSRYNIVRLLDCIEVAIDSIEKNPYMVDDVLRYVSIKDRIEKQTNCKSTRYQREAIRLANKDSEEGGDIYDTE